MVQFTNAEKCYVFMVKEEEIHTKSEYCNPAVIQVGVNLYFKTFLNVRDNLIMFGNFVKFKRNRKKQIKTTKSP